MKSRVRCGLYHVAGIVFALSAAVSATPFASDPGGPTPRGSRPADAAPTGSASIVGAAWRGDNKPIPRAKLRLRSVVSGKIRAVAIADDAGQFAFDHLESGSYFVELISDAGLIIAVGRTLSVAAGETVTTIVRTSTKVPWFTGFFGNAAAAVAAAAASTGVTAIAPEKMRCASPPCSIE